MYPATASSATRRVSAGITGERAFGMTGWCLSITMGKAKVLVSLLTRVDHIQRCAILGVIVDGRQCRPARDPRGPPRDGVSPVLPSHGVPAPAGLQTVSAPRMSLGMLSR